jgi:predicted P-loop ATPase
MGTGPDDVGLSLVDLTDDSAPNIGANVAQLLEQQRDQVRGNLDWPAGGIEWGPNGPSYKKPPRKSARNLERILSLDPEFRRRIRLNEHANVVEYDGRPLEDADVTALRLEIADVYNGVEFGANAVQELVVYQAGRQAFHPVRDYLEGLRWDKTPRIDSMLVDYARCADNEVNRVISRRFMISAVARVMQPGAKVDTVLILAGPQGYGKSTFFKTLAGDDWFRDDTLDLRNKDATMQLRGAWLYELAELASTRVRDAETVKAFISRPSDHFRPPYGRNVIEQKRQCVFVGTTNEPSFLNDPTGARRFWPAEVLGQIKTVELARNRDQLWAEAVAAYRARERWWLDLNEDRALAEAQEQYQHEDPWLPKVARWLDQPDTPSDGFTIETILNGAIQKDDDRQTKADEMRLGGILTALGYVKRRAMVDQVRSYRWFKRE